MKNILFICSFVITTISFSNKSTDYFYFRFDLKDSTKFFCEEEDRSFDPEYCHTYKKGELQVYVEVVEYFKKIPVDLFYYYEDIKNDETKIISKGVLIKHLDNYTRLSFKIKNQIDEINLKKFGRGIVGFNYAFENEVFNSLFYPLIKNDIYFTSIDSEENSRKNHYYSFWEIYEKISDTKETKVLQEMLDDIKSTASEMRIIMDSPEIIGGLFHGQDLFSAMENSKIEDVKEFLWYVTAAPEKYRGQDWKISEVYATWIYSKTPQATMIIGK